MKSRATTLFAVGLLFVGSTAFAAGYAVWEMGTRSSALGGVMTATANDPTAIFYNPAGLARLGGMQMTVDLTVINPNTEFSGVAPDPGYGVTEALEISTFYLPQAYFTRKINEDIGVGLGFYTPYGLAVEWQDKGLFSGRRIAYRTDLKTYFITPTAAWSPDEKLSVGLGINVVFASVDLDRFVVRNVPNPVDFGIAEISGTSDAAFGINAGVLYDVTETTTLGLSYKSKIDLDVTGDADFTAFVANAPLPADGPVETSLPLPSLFSIGIATQINERLLFEFNFNRIEWSAFDELQLAFPESPSANETIAEDYENSNQYRFGLEYMYRDDLDLRCGYVRDISPQPTSSTGPVLPDSDRNGFSIGAGWHRDQVTVDFYNLFLFLDDREVRDNSDGYNGDYRTYTTLTGLGLTYHF